VIAFLPHILDCQARCRNDYLETLRQLAEKFKKSPWGYDFSYLFVAYFHSSLYLLLFGRISYS
jgi:hypothetical protein